MKAAVAAVLLFCLSGAWSQGREEGESRGRDVPNVIVETSATTPDIWAELWDLRAMVADQTRALRTMEDMVIEARYETDFIKTKVEELEREKAENAALTGKATQSSYYSDGSPSKAIDGDRNGVWTHGSCTHTQDDLSPWWRVDLLKNYRVSSVTISNRVDCCSNRLDGAEIRIGNSLENNGIDNPRCAVLDWTLGAVQQTFQCDGMVGRYVTVVIPGRREFLTLCEVEVKGTRMTDSENDNAALVSRVTASEKEVTTLREELIVTKTDLQLQKNKTEDTENVAITGKATQSSMWGHWGTCSPINAIDGNRDGLWSHGSCTHTVCERNPWWRVDLLKTYNVSSVTISNRVDCCSHRLNGAEIRIGNSLDNNGINNPRCAVFQRSAGDIQTFQCDGMVGRYVTVVIPGRIECLTLCEVEVKGSALD